MMYFGLQLNSSSMLALGATSSFYIISPLYRGNNNKNILNEFPFAPKWRWPVFPAWEYYIFCIVYEQQLINCFLKTAV